VPSVTAEGRVKREDQWNAEATREQPYDGGILGVAMAMEDIEGRLAMRSPRASRCKCRENAPIPSVRRLECARASRDSLDVDAVKGLAVNLGHEDGHPMTETSLISA
jgi:hypothetical protein